MSEKKLNTKQKQLSISNGSITFGLLSRFPFFDHSNQIGHFPEFARHSSFHRGRHLMRAADLHEVMVHRMEGEGVNVIFDLL